MHSDILKTVAIRPEQQLWTQQSETLIDECILDKVTLSEHTWSTYLFNMPPNSTLNLTQNKATEIFVLEGSLTEGLSLHKKGHYLRYKENPKLTITAGEHGARLFYKSNLHSIFSGDNKTLQTNETPWLKGSVAGLEVLPLYSHLHENTALVKWAPNTDFHPHTHPGGEEIIVLEGTFHDETGSYSQGTWLRNPPYSRHTPFTLDDGAIIYVKTGHLPLHSNS